MKSDIELDKAYALIDRLTQELGIIVDEKAFGRKLTGPGNKHRVYVQRGRHLGRIDTTLPLDPSDPAFVQLGAPNGSIHCHVTPTLEQLERVIRMLADGSQSVQVPNKPRPFAPTKAPPVRRPKAVEEPVAQSALATTAESSTPERLLADRVAAIYATARAARIRGVMENPEKFGHMTEAEAAALVDGRGRIAAEDLSEASRNAMAAQDSAAIAESGLEIGP